MADAYGSRIQSTWRTQIQAEGKDKPLVYRVEGQCFINDDGTYQLKSVSAGKVTVTINGTPFTDASGTTWNNKAFSDDPQIAIDWDDTYGWIPKEFAKTRSQQTLTIVATYTLTKWSSTKNGGTNYTSGTSTATLNLTIPAISTRTLTFDANGGVGAPEAITEYADTAITIPSQIPTRAGYKFMGWAFYSGGAVKYQPGDEYTAPSSSTLYAIWAYGYGVSLNSITSKRCDANKSENDEGTYGVITGSYKLTGALANTGTLSAKYRKNGATSWTTVSNSLINPRTSTKAATDATKTVNFEIGPFGGEPTTSAALDTDSSYDIQVTVTDSGNNESALADYISTAFFTIDIQNGGKEIAFGTPANDTNLPSEGVFKCGMEMRLKDKTDSFRPILDYFYPVGSYYETSDSTFDPNVVWGGTWVPETEGQVHVSAGTGYIIGGALTNTSDGGAATVKLVTANMPAHSHEPSVTSENFVTSGDADANNTRVAYSSSGNRWVDGLTSQSHFHHRAATSSVGSGTAHENMPPYIVVNRWHRTA